MHVLEFCQLRFYTTNMKAKIYSFLIFIVSLTSCEEDTSLNKMVLDKIIYHENADQVGIYQYHQNGLIKRYEYHFDNILLYYTDYAYSGDKLSSKKIYEKTIAGDYKLLQQDIYNYEFGRLKSVYMGDSQENIFSFTWDGEKITRVDYSYSWNRTLQKSFL